MKNICFVILILFLFLQTITTRVQATSGTVPSDSSSSKVFTNESANHLAESGMCSVFRSQSNNSSVAFSSSSADHDVAGSAAFISSPQDREFELFQNFPNPFNSSTYIKIELGTDSFVSLSVFDVRGQPVAQLVNSFQPAGIYFVPWDGLDAQGNPLSSGAYYYRFIAEDFQDVKRLMLLR